MNSDELKQLDTDAVAEFREVREEAIAAAFSARLATPAEVGLMLSMKPRDVERLAEMGLIAHYRLGSIIRFSQSQVEDYLRQARVEKPQRICL